MLKLTLIKYQRSLNILEGR